MVRAWNLISVVCLATAAPFETIDSWDSLKTEVEAANGTASFLLSVPFDMGDSFQDGNQSTIQVSSRQANITIIGNGAKLAANYAASLFLVEDAMLVLTNVTLTGAVCKPNGAYGGAMYIGQGAKVEIYDCEFNTNGCGNYGGGSGGGIYIYGGAAELTNCYFTNNIASHSHGAAMYVGGGGSVQAENCLFNGNHAEGGSSYGGVLYLFDGTATLSNCTFVGNTADYQGGAIYVGNIAGSPSAVGANLLIKGCNFSAPSLNNDDIARHDQTSNVTFACGTGLTGAPVMMETLGLLTIPPASLKCN
jgi:predicted outer membrane repeat protein